MTNFPPSLNRVPGKSDAELQEEQILGKIRGAVSSLDKQSDAPVLEDAALDIYSTFLTARVRVLHRRKKGYASTVSVVKQLRQIETGLARLEGRLASADGNVFEALKDAAEDREAAKQEWLELRQLLLNMQERAGRAVRAAEAVVKAFPQAKGKKGRPVDPVAEAVSYAAAAAYVGRTGKRAVRSINRDTGEAEGKFHAFLTEVFHALGITASANASNLRLQETLKAMR
jgi:hypothetical protein